MAELDVAGFRIVVVDDQITNVEFMTALLERDGFQHVIGVTDPRRALDVIVAEDADLVVLDLMMPHVDGYEVLQGLRRVMPRDRFLPVLVMTADATPDARHRALELGATDFLTKPVNLLEATLRIRNLLHTRRLAEAERLRSERDAASLAAEPGATRERLDLLALALSETVGHLARVAEERGRARGEVADRGEGPDRSDHADRVGHIARTIAERLGIAGGYPRQLELAARLHDIGQVAVPSTVLTKAGSLTPDERAQVERHCEAGHAMLRGSRSLLLQLAAEIALAHHERWDGSGYPSGLAGSAIPLSARIVAVADVVDALRRDRDDRPAWPLDQVVEHLRAGAGTLFDPDVVAHALAWLSSPEGGGDAEHGSARP